MTPYSAKSSWLRLALVAAPLLVLTACNRAETSAPQTPAASSSPAAAASAVPPASVAPPTSGAPPVPAAPDNVTVAAPPVATALTGTPAPAPGTAPPSSAALPVLSEPLPVAPPPGFFLQRLPPGGDYRDGKLFHTVKKGQSFAWVTNRYLELTDHHTPAALKRAILARNGLPKPALSVGQALEIPDVRTIPLTATTVRKTRDFDARGVFLTMHSAAGDQLFTLIDAFLPEGLNTVVIDIKDMDGVISYSSRVPFAVATGANTRGPLRDLPKLINLLHARGLHVVARQVLFHDRITAQKLPHLALQSKSGEPWREHGKLVWVDPARKEIQDYNLALAIEAAELGVDEVQFDYIRFPAMGDVSSIDYSFDVEVTPKHQVITGFLKRAHEALKARGVLLSIDVYGVVAWDEGVDVRVTGQRLEDLTQYADVISPMVYPSHFFPPFAGYARPALQPRYFVHEGVSRTLRKIASGGGSARVRPWLQAFRYMVGDQFTPEYVATQLEAAHAAGATGWLLWDANNRYEIGLKGVRRWNETLRQRTASAAAIMAPPAR